MGVCMRVRMRRRKGPGNFALGEGHVALICGSSHLILACNSRRRMAFDSIDISSHVMLLLLLLALSFSFPLGHFHFPLALYLPVLLSLMLLLFLSLLCHVLLNGQPALVVKGGLSPMVKTGDWSRTRRLRVSRWPLLVAEGSRLTCGGRLSVSERWSPRMLRRARR